jgi:hypothetical protein
MIFYKLLKKKRSNIAMYYHFNLLQHPKRFSMLALLRQFLFTLHTNVNLFTEEFSRSARALKHLLF